jgi:hypothetical protein
LFTNARCRVAALGVAVAWLCAAGVVAGVSRGGARATARESAVSEDYEAIFGPSYAQAERFVRENPWIGRDLHLPRDEGTIAIAVVFPELIRFSAIEDEIQARGLKVLYVQYGRSCANFSIGRFQMKPSFAEQLERDAWRLFTAGERAAAGIPAFALEDAQAAREQRILRLDDLAWQVRYLRLFMLVMAKRYAAVSFAGPEDRLRFFATAYNAGYASGSAALRQKMRQKTFHTALFFADVRYSYADVATFHFRRQIAPR